MYSNHKSFHSIVVILLLIQLVIGTPFNISVADEVLQSSEVIESITPVENTVLSESTTTSLPLSEVTVTNDATMITYSEDSTTIVSTEDNTLSPTDTITTGWVATLPDITTNEFTGSSPTQEVIPIEIIEPSQSDTSTTGEINEWIPISWDSEIVSNAVQKTESLITFKPQKSIIIDSGLIDPLSINSYNVIDEHSDMTYCSYITYLNLHYITNLADESFMRWNAIDIWTNLTLQSTIEWTGEVIFTGTHLSGELFTEYISGLYTMSGSTVFDIVPFKPKSYNDNSEGLSLHQSHRFVVFLGTDLQRYVLDPVRTLSSEPVLLPSYLAQYIFEQEDIKIIQHYVLSNTDADIKDEKESLLTTGVQDDTAITIHSPMEFLPYVLQGLISAPNSGDSISNEVIFHTWFRYETTDGTLSAYIPAGLVIKTADWKNFNPFTFTIQELSGENNELSSGYENNFKFGIDGQHLVFSQPVALSMQTPAYTDGTSIDLMVQHEWQDWNKQWLTNNANAICNSDGSVHTDDQLIYNVVQNNKVSFYTCGASTFLINDIGITPNAAYGLRKLVSNYSGSLIRVRRSSDNTEQDIGLASANIAQNRTFSSDTLWDKWAGVTIAGWVVNISNAARIINQNMWLVTGRTYRVTILANKTGVDPSSRLRVTTSSSLTAEWINLVTQAANPANGLQVVQLDIVANGPILSIAADSHIWWGTISFVSVQDISSGVSKNDLDEGALLAFAGIGNAFVSIWYDQSGNARNATQTVAWNQPRIVNGWVLDTINNNKPWIRWFDTNWARLLQTAVAPFWSANESTVILVHKEIVRQNNVAWSLANDWQWIWRIFSHIPWVDGNLYFDVGWCCNSPQRLAWTYPFAINTTNTLTYTNSVSNNTKVVYGNGNVFLSGPAAAGTIVQLRIGSDWSIPINGMISEFMIFNSSISTAQRKVIEQSQASYFWLSGNYIPESPTNLSATSEVSQVWLTWVPPTYNGGSAITDYQVEYKLSSGTGWTIFADGVSTSTGTTVTWLTNSLSYDFRVSAINTNGTSTPSLSVNTIPQAISNMSLWLRSDMGVVASAWKVSSWIDQTGRGNTTVQNNTTNQPSLTQNAINFNPSINFTAASATRLEGTFSSRFTGTDITTLTVALPYASSNVWAGILTLWNSTGTNVDHNSLEWWVILHRYHSTSQIGAERQWTYYNTPENMLDRVRLFGSRFWGWIANIRVNGWLSYSGSATNGSFNADRYALGARFPNWSWYDNFLNWYIAETLVFNKILSSAEYNRVESYLGIKYGISLDQSTATNYTLSDSSISWNATTAGTYKNDIAGIARDNSFALNQTKSQSINNTGDIIVEVLSALDNKKSLVWANDGLYTGRSTTEMPTLWGLSVRLGREWKFQEKNWDIGNNIITYSISTWSLPNGTLFLLKDTDWNFTNGGTTIVTGTVISNYWTFSTNIQDNDYITFGFTYNGTVCIEWPNMFSWVLTPNNIAQVLDIQSDYFKVDDQKGNLSWYYTTLSVSSLTWSNWASIPTSAIQIKADPVTTLSWTYNSSVFVNPTITSYVSASSPVQFLKRNINTGPYTLWTYWSKLWMKINIPAYQSIGTYTWTITYTLYEN